MVILTPKAENVLFKLSYYELGHGGGESGRLHSSIEALLMDYQLLGLPQLLSKIFRGRTFNHVSNRNVTSTLGVEDYRTVEPCVMSNDVFFRRRRVSGHLFGLQ